MTACNRYQDCMVEFLYGELDAARQAEFDAHVGECATCASLLEEMRATLRLMSARRRPDPGAEYWDTYWERLEQRLARADSGARDASGLGRRRLIGSWGFRVAAAVLILAAGVWMGRSVLAPSPVRESPVPGELARGASDSIDVGPQQRENVATAPPAPANGGSAPAIDAPAGERAAPVELATTPGEPALRYLERSQVLLLALLNAEPGDGYASEVGSGRQRAGALLVEGREVRKSLSEDDRRLRELFDQLELILREIAHLEADADLESVDVIRGRLEREGVLLRINLEQMREAGGTGSPASKSDALD